MNLQMMIDEILGYLDLHDQFKATAFRNNIEYLKDLQEIELEWYVLRYYQMLFKKDK